MDSPIDITALHTISYGLYIVSSVFEGKKNGQIVNTAFQVSAKPPKIAISIHKENLTYEIISKSGIFSVSVLEEETPMTFIGTFGFKSGRNIDKLAGTKFETGPLGCPMVLEHSLAIMDAKITCQADARTHTVFIGDVVSSKVIKHGIPLTYVFYREKKKGKSPERATTYDGK